jgi:hypothetical protein
LKYFFDNNISPRFAAMLRALGVDSVALREEFPENISDEELFRALGGRDLIFVTGDRRIRTRQIETQALRLAKVTSLFLGPFWGKLNFWQQAAWLVTAWPGIEGFFTPVAKGTCAEIRRNRRIDPFQL